MRAISLLVSLFILAPLPADDPPAGKRQITEEEAFARADQLVSNVIEALDPSSMDIEDPRTVDIDHEEGLWVHSVQLRAIGDQPGGVRSHWVAAVLVVQGGIVTTMTPCRQSLRYYTRRGERVTLVSTAAESRLARAGTPRSGERLPNVPMHQSVRLDANESWGERLGKWEFAASYESVAGG